MPQALDNDGKIQLKTMLELVTHHSLFVKVCQYHVCIQFVYSYYIKTFYRIP